MMPLPQTVAPGWPPRLTAEKERFLELGICLMENENVARLQSADPECSLIPKTCRMESEDIASTSGCGAVGSVGKGLAFVPNLWPLPARCLSEMTCHCPEPFPPPPLGLFTIRHSPFAAFHRSPESFKRLSASRHVKELGLTTPRKTGISWRSFQAPVGKFFRFLGAIAWVVSSEWRAVRTTNGKWRMAGGGERSGFRTSPGSLRRFNPPFPPSVQRL
jgi:hypothetical protein